MCEPISMSENHFASWLIRNYYESSAYQYFVQSYIEPNRIIIYPETRLCENLKEKVIRNMVLSLQIREYVGGK
jgi:hypothetical protein